MRMRKHFILTPETLVSKRDVCLSFGSDNTIYIPLSVMESIENNYYDQFTERGKIARETLAYVGQFHSDELIRGVVQENGSVLKLITNYHEQELSTKISHTEISKLDRRVLQTCLGIKAEVAEDEPVILVSKKPSLRKKAEMLGVKAQTFRDELLPEIAEQYTGRMTLKVDDRRIKEFDEKKELLIKEVVPKNAIRNLYPNMFIKLESESSEAYGRIDGDKIVGLAFDRYYPYRVVPKNVGQCFMIEALMMDHRVAPLVIIKGPAGTAKTFMSLAVGLELVEKGQYPNNILISRSPTETGERIGHLPGNEEEKIMPYLRGAFDNLMALNNKHNKEEKSRNQCKTINNRNSSKRKEVYDQDEKPMYEDGSFFFERGYIKAEAVGFIRGRSICDTYIIIDEAQNLTPSEIKTIITRVGTGTKLVLLGDPAQIDRPELDERNNGLSYASERLKGETTCWQITLTDEESVRSELAKRASILL